jgi:Fic family protein
MFYINIITRLQTGQTKRLSFSKISQKIGQMLLNKLDIHIFIISYVFKRSAKIMIETNQRIEPARIEDAPEAISDVMAELSAISAKLDSALNPKTAASLAGLVRIMNTYYSNLIEGHNTRPADIEKALAGDLDSNEERRNLQIEAAAHVSVQTEIDQMAADKRLPEPASTDFILWLHRAFYKGASDEMLRIRSSDREFLMEPGQWRSRPEHNVAVGRHQPPSSENVSQFMIYFAERYRFDRLGKATRIFAIPAAHHRFNFIHPFPGGNGRVSRLMSHAMAQQAGIGAHGLWSISRGLARGLESRGDYKRMMDHADAPRQGDLDGRGNLSQAALVDFILWFLKICLDQVTFMASLFELETLAKRFKAYVERSNTLKPEALRLLQEALIRGEFDRGDVPRITGLPERTARRVFNDVLREGLLASETPKGPVSLRFPIAAQDILFPRLFAES